jgi:hypothetical protein
MPGSGKSHKNTIAMTLAWWYIRRLIRKRGTAAVAGLVAGEGLSLGRRPQKRHLLRWVLLFGVLAGVAVVVWRRRQGGGGDDWGDWEPVVPDVPPVPAEPAPVPAREPVPAPAA